MDILTERLSIRRFLPGDWRDLYEYLSQDAVVRFEPYGAFSKEACKLEAERRSRDEGFWAVCLKKCGKLIGNIYLSKRDYGTWELGYAFNERFHRKGYATEAARAMLDDVFTYCGARRVFAT